LKKSGKLDEGFIDRLAEIDEGTKEFEEFETYLRENALLSWSTPAERKDLPSSHFFDSTNKKYPYRNSDGTVNGAGVMAAWKLAHGTGNEGNVDSKIISRIKPYKDRCLLTKENRQKKQQEPFHRFSSPIPESFLESIHLGDKEKAIDIQCLRMGKFRHPWYGVLNFDQKFFNDIIRNFEADIPNPEIAFDFRHMPDYGAAAWINKFFVEDSSLMANVTLTDRGKESIKKKEFRYFSIEYTDDYIEYEFNEEVDENGAVIERESKISHGPTALGGGLTNRPFIKGMLPVSLHEDGDVKEIQLEEIKDENLQLTKEVNESMEKTLEELKVEQDEIKAKIKELEGKKDDSSKKELEDLATKLDEISAAVKELSDGGNDEATKTLEELEATKLSLDEANKRLKEKDEKLKNLSEDVKALSDTVAKLMKSNKVLEEKEYTSFIERKLEEFKRLGAFPGTLEIVRNIASSESAKKFSVTLSEGEGENKKDVEKSFFEVVESLLKSIPEDHRFTESESSASVTTPTGTSEDVSLDDVDAYAKEKKITFEEALIELSKEGKIE